MREAERTAALRAPVVRGPAPRATARRHPLHALHRSHGNRYVARVAESAGTLTPEVEGAIERSRGSGAPLGTDVRAKMEPALGADLSGVRIHTGANADGLSRVLGARAFTTGHDVFFRAGAYEPSSAGGRELLAHELVHVVQQSEEPVQAQLELGPVDDEGEREADAVARSVVQRWNEPETSAPLVVIAAPAAVRRACDGCSNEAPCTEGSEHAATVQRQPADGERAHPSTTVASPTATVPRRIKTWLNAFIPMATIPDPTAVFANDCFTGDARSYSDAIHASSRTHQEIEFDVSTLALTIDWKHIGTSHRVDCLTHAVKASATAPLSELTNGPVTRSGSNVVVHFVIAATNPLVPVAPAIDAVVDVHIDPARRVAFTTGDHDGFPAYEVYVTADGGGGVPVHLYDPRTAGEGPMALMAPMDKPGAGGPVPF